MAGTSSTDIGPQNIQNQPCRLGSAVSCTDSSVFDKAASLSSGDTDSDTTETQEDLLAPPALKDTTQLVSLVQQLQKDLAALRASSPSLQGSTVKEPKANDIEKFDGNPEKLDQFLTDLDTRFLLQPDRHASDITKTYVAMAHLIGTACSWALPIQQGYRNHLRDNWPAFLAELKSEF
jgi:hypothetical protein